MRRLRRSSKQRHQLADLNAFKRPHRILDLLGSMPAEIRKIIDRIPAGAAEEPDLRPKGPVAHAAGTRPQSITASVNGGAKHLTIDVSSRAAWLKFRRSSVGG